MVLLTVLQENEVAETVISKPGLLLWKYFPQIDWEDKSERRQSGSQPHPVCFYVLGLCKSSWPEALAFFYASGEK